jgi:hypothetical protein
LAGRHVLIGLRVGRVLAPEPFGLDEIRRTALIEQVIQEVAESM